MRPAVQAVDLPHGQGRKGIDWPWVIEQVVDQAPEWCYVGDFNPSMASHIRRRRFRNIDPDVVEVTVRSYPEGEGDGSGKVRLFMRARPDEGEDG